MLIGNLSVQCAETDLPCIRIEYDTMIAWLGYLKYRIENYFLTRCATAKKAIYTNFSLKHQSAARCWHSAGHRSRYRVNISPSAPHSAAQHCALCTLGPTLMGHQRPVTRTCIIHGVTTLASNYPLLCRSRAGHRVIMLPLYLLTE